MSRSGYSDDCSGWELVKWRGQVASATRGERGQRLLGDILDALESMPEKRLHAGVFDDGKDCVCALGAVARLRGIDVTKIDPDDFCGELIAPLLDIAYPLAAEVMFINDEVASLTPETRWADVYSWALKHFRGDRPPFAPLTSASFGGAKGEDCTDLVTFHRLQPPWLEDLCPSETVEHGPCVNNTGCGDRCLK